MGEFLPLVERLGPAAAWIVLLVGLLLYALERLTGWQGVITKVLQAIARRQITREQRAAELDATRRQRGSAEVRDLRRQVDYLERELASSRRESAARDSDAHQQQEELREQLRELRSELADARDQITELKRRVTAQEETP